MNKKILTKTCNRCHVEKPITEFNRRTANCDGIDNRCRQCENDKYHNNMKDPVFAARKKEISKQFFKNNPEKASEYFQKWLNQGNNRQIHAKRNYQSYLKRKARNEQ